MNVKRSICVVCLGLGMLFGGACNLVWAESKGYDLHVTNISGGKVPPSFSAATEERASPFQFSGQFLDQSHQPLSINVGMAGTWHDPASPGRGIFLDVLPRRKEVVLGWVTFDGDDPRWFAAQGPFDGSSADLTVYETQPKGPGTETVAVGAARLEFESCTSATLTHDVAISEPEEIHLSRLTPDVQCQTLQSMPRIPSLFALKGIAYASDEAGNKADCVVELLFELAPQLSQQGRITYTVLGGGRVSRGAVDANGDGIGIFADVFIPEGTVEWRPPFGIKISGPGSPDDPHPLFRGLAFFEGISESSGRAVGSWTCGKLEYEEETGYVDPGPVAEGTWYIDLLPQTPVDQ